MTLESGARIAQYEIRGPLGAGGMGVVYRAFDTRLKRDVAIKLLSTSAPADGRLLHEARAIAALNHRHICTVYEVGAVGDVSFIAMEFLEGRSLRDLVAGRRWPAERVCRIGRELGEALEHAHAHNIVHRDFKTANVMVTADGHAKVVDFGIAIRTTGLADSTQTLDVLGGEDRISGTVPYIAPEVLQGAIPDARTDIWALGIVLYELTSGQLPFNGRNASEVIAAILRDPLPPLPQGTPAGLARIIARCLAKEPVDRPAHAGEVAAALDVIESGLQPSTLGNPVLRRGARFGLVAGTVAALAAVVALVYALWPRAEREPVSVRFGNPVQVTAAEGVEEFPAWSPDGRTLAYAANASGAYSFSPGAAWDVWVAQPGSTPINRTADHAGRDLFPSWSPDGTQIAFWSERDGGGCYVMPALGGAARRLARASLVDPNPPQWFAGGAEIGCVSGDAKDAGVDVVSVQTGQVLRRIPLPAPADGRRMFVTFDHDRRRIALVTSTAGLAADVTQLMVLDVASGRVSPITDGQMKVWSANWSSDGRSLFYVAPAGGAMDLWEQRLTEDSVALGPPQALTTGIGIRNATLSDDGRRLGYSQGRKVANVWRVPIRPDKPATWADAQQLTFEQAFIECVALDKAGTRLAISSDRSGTFDLWTLPSTGGPMTQVTSDRSAEWCPNWSPDGTTLAFFAHRSGNREIWTVPAVGGEWRQVTNTPGPELHPSWSFDGRWIAFTSGRDGRSVGWMSPADGGPGWMIAPGGAPSFSPTDPRLAFQSDGRLWITNPSVSVPARPLPTSGFGPMRWTPDGRNLVYRASQYRIAIVAADGDTPERTLVELSGRRGALGDHGTPTDGKFIYFTWNEDLGDLWVMER